MYAEHACIQTYMHARTHNTHTTTFTCHNFALEDERSGANSWPLTCKAITLLSHFKSRLFTNWVVFTLHARGHGFDPLTGQDLFGFFSPALLNMHVCICLCIWSFEQSSMQSIILIIQAVYQEIYHWSFRQCIMIIQAVFLAFFKQCSQIVHNSVIWSNTAQTTI